VFQDRAKIWVEGGAGGNGVVSFRREAHVPRGGPDGGDGARGGDVVLVADRSRRDLASMRISRHYRAGRGGHGEGSNRHGARGQDLIVQVPPGTTVEGLEGESFDLVEEGQRAVVAQGGPGGHGNKRFASSTQRAPRFAERGLPGASGWVELHLKLLADAGLVGLPNAGKSSLLARLTRAAPKVADYPFTTIQPVLGTIEGADRQLVLADIPGLIEGAAEGVGLGHEFLAHVERCRLLIHLLEIGPGTDPEAAYETVRRELAAHGGGLERLPELIALSKADLVPEAERAELVEGWRCRAPGAVRVLAVSAATGVGLEELTKAIFEAAEKGSREEAGRDAPATADQAGGGFESEHRVYRPAAADGFSVERLDDGSFEVSGRGIEMLLRRHDLGNPEAVAYVERRLAEIGVVKELRRAGFSDGDEVVIGGEAFEFHPGA
jgi:GTP-binding protein